MRVLSRKRRYCRGGVEALRDTPRRERGTLRPHCARPGHGLRSGRPVRHGRRRVYPEGVPTVEWRVDGFWMDESPVTVGSVSHDSFARPAMSLSPNGPWTRRLPDADPELLVPGSLVFRPTRGRSRLDDFRSWWKYVPGACWKHPEGPGARVNRPGPPPGRAGVVRGREGLRALGRQAAADRGGVGVRGPRRAGGRRFAWGDERHRTAMRWRTSGRASFPGRT